METITPPRSESPEDKAVEQEEEESDGEEEIDIDAI